MNGVDFTSDEAPDELSREPPRPGIGHVIQSIDGRAPTSVQHALRILSSYQPGENLELRIMRDRKRETLTVEMPEGTVGHLFEAPIVIPSVAPVAPIAPIAPRARIAIIEET